MTCRGSASHRHNCPNSILISGLRSPRVPRIQIVLWRLIKQDYFECNGPLCSLLPFSPHRQLLQLVGGASTQKRKRKQVGRLSLVVSLMRVAVAAGMTATAADLVSAPSPPPDIEYPARAAVSPAAGRGRHGTGSVLALNLISTDSGWQSCATSGIPG